MTVCRCTIEHGLNEVYGIRRPLGAECLAQIRREACYHQPNQTNLGTIPDQGLTYEWTVRRRTRRRPGTGDETRGWGPPFIADQSGYFISINRNKKSMTLDLKSPDGLAVLKRLVERADVLVENFRPGTLSRLGLDWPAAQKLNPGLIYCAISGFGQDGPRANQPAYDQIIQGLSGAMSLTGPVEGPPTKFGVAISDIGAGMWAACAINAALYHRERTGRGQFIDTSMLSGMV